VGSPQILPLPKGGGRIKEKESSAFREFD